MKRLMLVVALTVLLAGCLDEKERRVVAEASRIIAVGTFVVEKRTYGPDEDGKASCILTFKRPYWGSSERFIARFYGDGMKECMDAPINALADITWSTLPGNIYHVQVLRISQ
ncbi:MAG: hypothetical protein HYT94_03535 [Parcubacteria group bacterium]|nr:hypothetical protein [Parcubacteria group bacterium]